MAVEYEHLRTEDVLEQQQKFLNDQLERHTRNISKLKARKRRFILYRMVSLFLGIVLMLFGFIDLIVVESLDANFKNIIIFTLSELAAIPLLRYSFVVFRKMSIDQDIDDIAESIVHTQDNLTQLNEERLAILRGPEKQTKTVVRPGMLKENLIDADALLAIEDSKECPDCGKKTPLKASICRNCGHLFI
jgi:hypothetical protein